MVFPLLLASLLLAGPSASDALAILLDEPTPQWPAGPARYILKRKEEEKYRALKTLPERRAFIESFWLALDPTPDTPFNEKRAEFWKRVNLAQALFHESVKPGWKTDRGKIYVLLGPPNEMHRRGSSEIWTYRALPMPNTPPEIGLGFYCDRSGEYTLAPTPVRYHPLAGRHSGRKGYLGDSPISLRFDLGGAQNVPGRILLPETSVSTQYFFPVLHPVDSYRTYRAADGSTFLVIDLIVTPQEFQSDFDPKAPLNMTLSASLFSESGGDAVSRFTRPMTLDSHPEDVLGGSLHFQTGIDLPPGRYRGEFTLLEVRSHLGAIFSRTLTVPDYRQGLSLSSVTVSRPRKQVSDLGLSRPGDSPWFSSGDTNFTSGETLFFSYQVYNSTHQTDHAELDVEYHFFLVQGIAMQPVGQVVQFFGVQKESIGYTLPLLKWPAGDYRIQVVVTDRLTGANAFREAAFQITAGSGSPQATSHAAPP